ncbi:MAG: hypothetical protein R3B91_06445 [Planctomycetaceae bacterium]
MPYHGLEQDNNLRPDSTLEKMAKLSPAFTKDGTLTAANSTSFTDGASAVLLATEEWAAAKNLPVLAYITSGETAAVDFVEGHEAMLMEGGAYAIPRMLDKRGLSLQDFDYYEIHEAFAAVVLCTLKASNRPSSAATNSVATLRSAASTATSSM